MTLKRFSDACVTAGVSKGLKYSVALYTFGFLVLLGGMFYCTTLLSSNYALPVLFLGVLGYVSSYRLFSQNPQKSLKVMRVLSVLALPGIALGVFSYVYL